MGFELDNWGSNSGRVSDFSLHCRIQTGSGTHAPPYQMGTGSPSVGIKRPEHEVDHSPPFNAEALTRKVLPLLPLRLYDVVLS